MSLTITGKLNKKERIETGSTKSGKEWKKQLFVIETGEQYHPQICFQVFGEEKIDILSRFNIGEQVTVHFNLSSREWNGRYFHNIDAWRIEKVGDSAQARSSEDIPVFDAPASEEDDLPF